MAMAQAAKDLLKRAVELDSAQKYSEALICYEEGIQNLLRTMGECRSDAEQKELRKKAEEYLGRAEGLKQLVKEQEGPVERVHYVHIKAGEIGHSYETLFQKCLDGNVEWVEVQDPYIRARHQVHNMVRFCELLVETCKKLKRIQLTTGAGETHGAEVSSLKELQESLREHNVELVITYSSTLHDREVRYSFLLLLRKFHDSLRFSNGWIVKIGRGLDYFQRPKGQFSIGSNNFDLRPCHETTVEIFHRLNVSKIPHR